MLVGGGPLTVCRGSVGDLSGVLVVLQGLVGDSLVGVSVGGSPLGVLMVCQGSVGGSFWDLCWGSPLGVSIKGLHQSLHQVSIRGPSGFH